MASSRYCDSAIDVDNSLSIMGAGHGLRELGQKFVCRQLLHEEHHHGDPEIQGEFGQSELIIEAGKAKDISKIEKKHFTHFTDIARKVEDNFKEIREIKFTNRGGRFLARRAERGDEKSTQSQIKALLDLTRRRSSPTPGRSRR